MAFLFAWKTIFIVTVSVTIAVWSTIAKGQPTVPESELRWADSCGTKDTISALELLTQDIENQGIEARILKVEMAALREESKQFRVVLTQVVSSLHQLVSNMAARYPCHCDL